MTIEEFGEQPIEHIITHSAFVKIVLDKNDFSPFIWEVTMECDTHSNGIYYFCGLPSPYKYFKFYKVFTPITRKNKS